MVGLSRTNSPSTLPMSRDLVLTLLRAALQSVELRYARRLCAAWLAVFPGDMLVNLFYARAYNQESSIELRLNALPILEELCRLDPEFVEAQELLAEARLLSGAENHLIAKACANALTHGREIRGENSNHISSWAKYVHEARNALNIVKAGDYQQIEKAEHFIHKALIENPETPLAAVIHLRLLESKGSMPKIAVRNLAQIYHERWPDCLQFQLSLSNELIESGEASDAVSMLHQAVAKDIAGQVATRLWGDQHQYRSLWPAKLEVHNSGPNSPQNIPVPAAVASSLGWNQIPALVTGDEKVNSYQNVPGSQPFIHEQRFDTYTHHPYVPHSYSMDPSDDDLSEHSKEVQSEFERMADDLNRPHLVREDGRFPVYVIFTTRGGLEAHYNTNALQAIDPVLKKLASVIHGRKINQEYWGSLLFYADDVTYTQPFQLQPALYTDPWQLKLILADLDGALEKRGERIGALLIVGGPEIVPYHHLPNPVEDADVDVPSDNPYAAKDSNYFISDWPVGRVSGGADNDPHQLIMMLNDIINRHDPRARKLAWYYRFIRYMQELFRRGISKKQSSFGYTAAVWRKASLSVFRSIGESSDLLVSPPVHACASQDTSGAEQANRPGKADTCLLLPSAHLGYFNLHGVPDGCEWFGQSDPVLPEYGPDYPVAMRPQDIRNSGSAPHLVFTEACYGVNIIEKSIDDAIALKFISSGTSAVVGSTCISYGSLSTPLSAADLLGRVFWSLLQEGFTAGESLRRAKIHLTREMHRRQGFLDAEDQKTLVSFLLVGDPLAQPFQTKTSPKITPHLSDAAVPVPTVCEHAYENGAESPVTLETIAHLKGIVEQYLPGMGDADVRLTEERKTCSNFCHHCSPGRQCALSKANNKADLKAKTQRRVLTLSKSFERAQHIHRQYARLTLDESGKIIKMVVSH